MEERINMSIRELSRLDTLTKVHEKRLTIKQATEDLSLSDRQVKRLSKRLKLEGPKGLISKKIGAKSNHQLQPGLEEAIVEII